VELNEMARRMKNNDGESEDVLFDIRRGARTFAVNDWGYFLNLYLAVGQAILFYRHF